MKLPLVVYGLLFTLLLLVYAVYQARKPKRPQASWGEGEGAAQGQAMAEIVMDWQRMLMVLAGAALLSIIFGKPGLLPQYAAWVVVIGQVLKVATIWTERKGMTAVLRVVVLVCAGYIWFMQLPYFDALPR